MQLKAISIKSLLNKWRRRKWEYLVGLSEMTGVV